MKKLMILAAFGLTLTLQANKISAEQCAAKPDNFLFAGGECIEYRAFNGEDNDRIIIIVHGVWKDGANTLGRYAPFAESMNMNTDLTTIAVALPGYSGSSTNTLKSLGTKGEKHLAATQAYVAFLGALVTKLKEKFGAKTVYYIGHSAGAMMGATLTGVMPGLINGIALAGGRYDVHAVNTTKGLISISDYMDALDKNTKYLLIYGTKDEISRPEVTTTFYQQAKAKGLNVTLIEVKDAPHIDLDMTDPAVEAITKMVE